jgi:hypothetical protein
MKTGEVGGNEERAGGERGRTDDGDFGDFTVAEEANGLVGERLAVDRREPSGPGEAGRWYVKTVSVLIEKRKRGSA